MMKKLALATGAVLFSGASFAAGFNAEVGVGYQTSTVASNYGDCWSECYGNTEPAGLALEGKVSIAGVFATFETANTKQVDDMYNSKVTDTWQESSFGVGYALPLNSDSDVTAALEHNSVKWMYDWTDYGIYDYVYTAQDSGNSLVIGANTKVTDKVKMGASFSTGFAKGIKAYTQIALTDMVAVKVAYAQTSYQVDSWQYDAYWHPTTGSSYGDAAMRFDNQTMRVSAQVQF